MVATLARSAVEYTNFSYQHWYSGDNWSSLSGSDRDLIPQARAYFWLNYESKIRGEFEKLQAQGWESVEEIGPNAIKLRRFESGDRGLDPADVLLWVMTLGIGFIFHLLFERPTRYVSYVPVECRVKMRRAVVLPVVAPGEALSAS